MKLEKYVYFWFFYWLFRSVIHSFPTNAQVINPVLRQAFKKVGILLLPNMTKRREVLYKTIGSGLTELKTKESIKRQPNSRVFEFFFCSSLVCQRH